MARNNSSKTAPTAPRVQGQSEAAGGAGMGNVGDAIEQQVVAFAEQLGRVVGTVQAKAEGWLDPRALTDQVARVRDSAASLLQQLGMPGEQKAEQKTEQTTEPKTSGRSGHASITTAIRAKKPADAAAASSTRPERSIASRRRMCRMSPRASAQPIAAASPR